MTEPITITITLDYDAAEHNGMEPRNFLYHFLNQLNREVPIIGIEYKGESREFTPESTLADLPLRVVDSINEEDVPKPPEDITVIPSLAPQPEEIPTPLDF